MPILQVKAKPNSRVSQLSLQADGTWLAHLKAAPVDGKRPQPKQEGQDGYGCNRLRRPRPDPLSPP